jgi:hypothetical protein
MPLCFGFGSLVDAFNVRRKDEPAQPTGYSHLQLTAITSRQLLGFGRERPH